MLKNKAKLYSSKTQKSRTLFWVRYRVESTGKDGCITSYTFDQNGQMIEKTETREQEETTRNYIYLGSKIIAHVEAEETYYYGTDHLGSTVLMTNEAGEVTWTGEVTPFADSESVSDDSEHVMYTGKELDPDTGLYYFNARWYDPQIGRFTTEDPIRDGLNWYAYCSNNPLRFVDPSGLEDAPIPSSDEIAEAYDEIYGEGNSEWSSVGGKDDENNSNGNGGSGKSDSNNNKPDTTTGTGSTDKKDKKSDSDGDNDNDDVIVEEGGNNKYSSTEEAFKGKKDADKWIAEVEDEATVKRYVKELRKPTLWDIVQLPLIGLSKAASGEKYVGYKTDNNVEVKAMGIGIKSDFNILKGNFFSTVEILLGGKMSGNSESGNMSGGVSALKGTLELGIKNSSINFNAIASVIEAFFSIPTGVKSLNVDTKGFIGAGLGFTIGAIEFGGTSGMGYGGSFNFNFDR